MSWQGIKNESLGIAGIDDNNKIHALDGSQLTDLTKAQVGLSNVQDVDTTIAANVVLDAVFSPSNTTIAALDNLQTVAQKSQGQITAIANLSEFIPTNTIYVAANGNDITGDGSELNPYQTINFAISVATNGTSIEIFPSFYNETVSVNKQISLNCLNFVTIANLEFISGSQGSVINNANINGTISSNSFGGIRFNNINVSGISGDYATRLYSAAQFADILLLPSLQTGLYIGYLDGSSDIQVYDTTNAVSVNISALMPNAAITYNSTNQFLTITQAFMATIFTGYSNNNSQALTINFNGDFSVTGGFDFINCSISGTQNFNCGNTNISALNTSTLGWQTNIFTEFGTATYLLGLTIMAPIYHAGGILFVVEGVSWASDPLSVILYSPANVSGFSNVFAINGNINAQFGSSLGTIQQTGTGYYAINVGFHGATSGNLFNGTRIPFNSASNLFANYTPTNYAIGDGYVQNALLGIDNKLGTLSNLANFHTGKTWFVSTNGTNGASGSELDPLLTISAAITAATAGDTIIIANGIYTESLTINKQLYIVSDLYAATIDGDIDISVADVVISGIRYTQTLSIVDTGGIILSNIRSSIAGSNTAISVTGTLTGAIFFLNCFVQSGDVVFNTVASGQHYMDGGYYAGVISLSGTGVLTIDGLSFIGGIEISDTWQAIVTDVQLIIGIIHNAGLLALNNIQYVLNSITSTADDSTSQNVLFLQNINLIDPVSGSANIINKTGNCNYAIGVAVNRNPSGDTLNGVRYNINYANDLFANYTPTNYAIGDGYVQNALLGIDNAIGFRPTQTWYVAINGNDTTGNGSELNPYQTIGQALSVAISNDTIKLLPGTYTEDITISININIIADKNTVIIDGDITIGSGTNDQIVSLQGFTYTGTCTTTSLSELKMYNIVEPNNNTALSIDGSVSSVFLLDCYFTGSIIDTVTSSGLLTIIGGINMSITITSSIGMISNCQQLLILTYSGSTNALVNGCQVATIIHNSGLVSLNGVQNCQSFISNADNSTPINTFNLQNVNFQNPVSGSFASLTQNGNCNFSLGAGVAYDPSTVFTGTRLYSSTAINIASSYTPTNYTAINPSVRGSLEGIDNELASILSIISPPIDSFNTGQSLTAANRTVHITDTGLTFTFPDATTMTIDLEYNIKAINIATATINTFGAQTIDGASNHILTNYQNVTYYSDGTNLFIR